tara:strand:- start:11202 stop:12551 length:1350 start_codon:yes stop_codon:yes gene_type:complete
MYLKNILKKLFFNDDVNGDKREVFSATFIILTLKLFFTFIGLMLSIVITRYLNTTEAGYYFFMISVVVLLSVVGRVGLDNAIVRFIAIANKKLALPKINYILLLSTRLALPASVTIAVVLWVFGQYGVPRLIDDHAYVSPLLWAAYIIPILSLYLVYVHGFQGLKQIITFALFNGAVRLLNLIGLLVIIFLFGELSLEQVFSIYFIAHLLALLLIIGVWTKRNGNVGLLYKQKDRFVDNANVFKNKFYSCSFSLWGIACLAIVMGQGAQVLLGLFSNAEQVAYFAVANRIAMLVSFILLAINGVLSPKFAEISNDNDIQRLQKLYRSSTNLMIVVACPILVLSFIFSADILSLFGPQYQAASTTLRVLVAAQFVKVIVGAVGQLLIMTGKEQVQRKNLAVAVISLLILSLILMPNYGALGAAIATFVAMTINNGLGLFNVIKKLNIKLF